MSKVLVDRELLELLRNFTVQNDSGVAGALRGNIDRLLAQPAEAEGMSNARLMNTLAELARRAPLRTLHTICETQRQVSTVKLERYLEPVGDTLAGYAFTLRIDYDKLSAALSAVTAERDAANSRLHEVAVACTEAEQERDQLRAEVERYVPLHEAVQRAAGELPEGWAIQLYIERNGGGVELIGPDGTEDFATNNEHLDCTVIDALEAAMAAKEA